MSLQLAEQFEANEQYEQAYQEYQKSLEQSPDDLGILERLGHLALILEKPEEAANYYHKILEKDVTNPLAYEQLMSIYENTDRYKYYVYRGNKNSLEGKLEFAINDFKKALSHASEETQIVMTRLTLANLYRQLGNTMKAIDEYNFILEYDNLHEDIFLQLADIYLKDGAHPSAIDALMRAKQKGFDTDKINEALAAVYLKSGDPEKTIEFTKDELLKIQAMLEIGKVDEAYEKLQSLPEDYKKTPRYYTLQAQYYYSAKEFDKALEFIDEYDKMVPNSPLTYQMRALVYEEKGDEYNTHLNWGKYNITRKNIDVAINEFLNAVQLKDDDIDLLFTLASLLTDTGETNHAAEYYEKIVELDPNNKEALRKLASFREGIGDYKMQVHYLEKIVDVDPKDLGALKDLARGYERIKSNKKAIEIYQKYLDLVKDPVDHKMAQARLDKLTSSVSDEEESVGLIDKIMKFFGPKM